ncbi:MAG: hypothetical protein ACK2T5_05965 [Anaerolineales bacterium]|jgi:hypothetical protein
MNRPGQSLLWQRILLAAIIFIAVLGLAFVFRDQITEIILIPILYILWVVDVALQMFGQRCIWFAALMIALLLSLFFSRRNERPVKELDRTVYSRGPAEGRINFWRRRVRVNTRAINAVSYRRSEMYHLVIRALAYHENSNAQEIEERLQAGEIHVPPGVSSILGLDDRSVEARHQVHLLEAIKLRLRWMMARFFSPKYLPDSKIEQIAEYLESLMEVDYDA